MKRTTRFAVLLVVLMMSLAFNVMAQDKKILYTGRQMGPDDIPSLDPSRASDVPSVQIIAELFPELNRLNETQVIAEPGVATVAKSDDGLTYTFTINDGISWVKYNPDTDAVEQVMVDGAPRMLTAQDFVTTMVRTLDPVVASDYAGVLAPWIVGANEFKSSDPAADEATRTALIDALGVKAVDDKTLEITATKASAALDNIFAMWITTGTPGWLIEEYGDLWIEPENIASYGPFALKEWNHGQDLTLIKNPFWAGNDAIPAAKIDEVVFRFLDSEPQLASFEADELAVSEVPPSEFDRITADATMSAELSNNYGSCSYYYGFNVTREPFNDPRAVLAFSEAIDREAIVTNVLGQGQKPAGFFTLPSVTAAPHQEDYPDYAVKSDPVAAKALWDEYLASVGKTSADFSLTLLHNNSNTHAAIAQAVQQMWKETLGVEVQISAQEFGVYLDTRRDADIFRAGWCFDYPDTNNFLFDVFHSSVDPDNHFSNADYDKLVEDAAVAATPEERSALYAQAENILVRTGASIAPIYYYVTLDLTKPNVERTHSVIGREYYEKWDLK